tara:strand:- start:1986 stop:2918 length:933 start_codon:yes stop_codon:yes gene_type:complete
VVEKKLKEIYRGIRVFISLTCFVFPHILCFSQDDFDFDFEFEEENTKTFNSTRIISGHSVEILPAKTYEMRIEHRFGDIAGAAGGFQTMFGFDNVSDMRIALEYGISEKVMVGFGRCKGTGVPYRSLLDGFFKYKLLDQKKSKVPLSLTVVSGATFTYQKASSDISGVTHFPKVAHRFAYFSEINLARRFGNILSLSLIPTLVHRNYVAADDQNTLFSLGSALRMKLSKKFFFMMEYYHCFNSSSFRQQGYQNSLGIALEWGTFGHNFTINFTNSRGLGENQFIPYTYQRWLDGQFRLGFCVSRQFTFEK